MKTDIQALLTEATMCADPDVLLDNLEVYDPGERRSLVDQLKRWRDSRSKLDPTAVEYRPDGRVALVLDHSQVRFLALAVELVTMGDDGGTLHAQLSGLEDYRVEDFTDLVMKLGGVR